jgi:hypothetical protein
LCDKGYPLSGWLTILKIAEDSIKDATQVALVALSWILSDSLRAQRFMNVTGLTPGRLRAAIGDPATHLAVLEFLCAHEPDLIAAAESLGYEPGELAAARDRIAT